VLVLLSSADEEDEDDDEELSLELLLSALVSPVDASVSDAPPLSSAGHPASRMPSTPWIRALIERESSRG
jgi:hypothetical protein